MNLNPNDSEGSNQAKKNKPQVPYHMSDYLDNPRTYASQTTEFYRPRDTYQPRSLGLELHLSIPIKFVDSKHILAMITY